MAVLSTEDLDTMWAEYMRDISRRHEEIGPITKHELRRMFDAANVSLDVVKPTLPVPDEISGKADETAVDVVADAHSKSSDYRNALKADLTNTTIAALSNDQHKALVAAVVRKHSEAK